ncbi:plasmid pRiA4b ORF-3 family protein [Dactylosporangium sp. NPDC051484]|uniref:plasmid pRiA4b ORF-3 family protein n=1 Tax=Dactylosporangium sp. NPDC051484 TaxID=3154942 RepID=UPI003451119D
MLRVVGEPVSCDCPACSDPDFDPEQAFGELADATSELAAVDDPLDAEIGAATLLAICSANGAEGAVADLISHFESRSTAGTLAMLLAIGSVAPGDVGAAARAAAGRLARAGVAKPVWADEIAAPVTVENCRRVFDLQGTASMLVCSFQRAERGHMLVLSVDHTDCDAAVDVMLGEAADLPEVLKEMRASGRKNGLDIKTESMEPAELRWWIENALDARDVHDAEGADDESAELFDAEGPGYPVLATLVRARMAALPESDKPPAPHGGFAAAPALAPKRTKLAGPAPIYQVKVGLKGATPPIWRRLEVPADVSLARLHDIIQAAFGWNDSHMHVFETPFGDFGVADRELGYGSDKSVTLEQVAPEVKSKIRYVYDFGDNWQHELLVEKVLDRDPVVRYPRCTGGRRAAPPDDCGGIWGYLDLIEALKDPDHPEHRDSMDWVGIDDIADFTPERFDAKSVNTALSGLT